MTDAFGNYSKICRSVLGRTSTSRTGLSVPDGVERLLHTRGAVIRDEEGDSIRLVGVTIDMARRGNELLAS